METYGFLVISGDAECEHWLEMGLKYTFLTCSLVTFERP